MINLRNVSYYIIHCERGIHVVNIASSFQTIGIDLSERIQCSNPN